MILLWVYAVVKFLVTGRFLSAYHVNPWLFLFLDTITVPTYVLGWNTLISSMAGSIRTFKHLLIWSVITFVSSTAPYLYAAWAGRRSFPRQVWFLLTLIMVLLLISQIRKTCSRKPL